jgi:hypothetical protein
LCKVIAKIMLFSDLVIENVTKILFCPQLALPLNKVGCVSKIKMNKF